MRKLVLAMAAGCFGVVLVAQPSSAADARFPTAARTFTTWLVRAFDQCTPGGLSVIGAGVPTTGCVANVSDDLPPGDPLGATMKYAKVTVRRFPGRSGGQGRLKIAGRGFQPGQRLQVRLTLRTTRSGVGTKHPPSTSSSVTFADTTVDCGVGNANCFVARPNGSLTGAQTLTDCLTQNATPTGLALENVEIVEAALVNCDTGNVVGKPGILN